MREARKGGRGERIVKMDNETERKDRRVEE